MSFIPNNLGHIQSVIERRVHLRPVGSWSQWAQSMRNLTGEREKTIRWRLFGKSAKQSLNVGEQKVWRHELFFLAVVWLWSRTHGCDCRYCRKYCKRTIQDEECWDGEFVWQARRTHVVLAMAFHAACGNPQGVMGWDYMAVPDWYPNYYNVYRCIQYFLRTYTYIYIYINTWNLFVLYFWASTLQNEALSCPFQQKQGSFGFQVIYIYTYATLYNTLQSPTEL